MLSKNWSIAILTTIGSALAICFDYVKVLLKHDAGSTFNFMPGILFIRGESRIRWFICIDHQSHEIHQTFSVADNFPSCAWFDFNSCAASRYQAFKFHLAIFHDAGQLHECGRFLMDNNRIIYYHSPIIDLTISVIFRYLVVRNI